jgi:hypothetical protein
MSKRPCSYVLTGFVILMLAGACGGGMKDSPGVVVSAVITPTYNDANIYSVDVVQSSCQDLSNASIIEDEYYADHGATVSISASLINPSNTVNQMTVTIDRYTITYQRSPDSSDAPPIQSDTREKTLTFTIIGEDTTTADFSTTFFDLIRKERYYDDVVSGEYSAGKTFLNNNYTATYTFSGHAENGVPFSFTSQTDFQIGSFNNCPAGFSPI